MNRILLSLLFFCSFAIAQEEQVAQEEETQMPIFEAAVIGEQTWLRYDLNVVSETDSWCYNNDPENCVEYGRLYSWATAMDLPAACNQSSCADKIKTPHRGICPDGFHIPSKADWDKLFTFVSRASGTDNKKEVRTKLRADYGWKNSFLVFKNNGTDDYGFRAMPGGHRNSDGSFGSAGGGAEWWSTGEEELNSKYAYHQNIVCWPSSECLKNGFDKSMGLSVRCLKD